MRTIYITSALVCGYILTSNRQNTTQKDDPDRVARIIQKQGGEGWLYGTAITPERSPGLCLAFGSWALEVVLRAGNNPTYIGLYRHRNIGMGPYRDPEGHTELNDKGHTVMEGRDNDFQFVLEQYKHPEFQRRTGFEQLTTDYCIELRHWDVRAKIL